MNVRRLAGVLGVLVGSSCSALGETVSWIQGQVVPSAWTISPVQPNAAEVITFQGPCQVFSSQCQAEYAMGGTPDLRIDSSLRVVELRFLPPAPSFCVVTWSPVCGLTGSFGSLDAGIWTFRCRQSGVTFEIPFTVSTRFPIHVDAAAPGPFHDGKTWTSGLTSLQDALARAVAGDQILVAQGTYTPDVGQGINRGDRHASFQMKTGVALKGGYGGFLAGSTNVRDATLYSTILSGDLEGDDKASFVNTLDNSLHVVTASEVDSGAVLDGFVIRDGQADGDLSDRYGGGLYIHAACPTISWCTLTDNWATLGGAIHSVYGQPFFSHCTVRGNWAWIRGGGLYSTDSSPVVDNCLFVGNRADHAVLSTGGAICCVDGGLTLTNSTLAGNLATAGRALGFYAWTPQASGVHRITNCILWDGSTSEIKADSGSVLSVSYCCIQGGYAGSGNINADPRFVVAGSWTDGLWSDGDYHLRSDSPCINKGDPSRAAVFGETDIDGELRVAGSRVDMGADEQGGGSSNPQAASPSLTFDLWETLYPLQQDTGAADPVRTFLGYVDQTINLNLKARFSVDVQATSAAGGAWSGWTVPEVAGPGQVTVRIWVRGQGVDASSLASGTSVRAAEVSVSVASVP